jgi:IS1 family transposase
LDKKTREIVGCYIGERSKQGARGLWNSLPSIYRQCAVCYTDYWAAPQQVIPSKRHKAVGKNSGLTNYSLSQVDEVQCDQPELAGKYKITKITSL